VFCDALQPGFRIEVSPDGDGTVVRPFGEVDLATAPALEARAVEILDGGCPHLVIDLRGVSFIDSTGIRVLIVATRHARELAARTSVIVGSGQTRRVLELACVLDHLEVEDPDADGTLRGLSG
jgi:anti-sigma B factor antagonist